MTDIDPKVKALKEQMLQKSYYVMFRTVEDRVKISPVLLDHYQWMIRLEKENHVLASGPMFKNDGSQGVGMTVFRCGGFAEADALASQDPFVICGAVSYEVQRWQINEGRINVSVDFSDQTYSFS
jgi:uncharacterized protein YciI